MATFAAEFIPGKVFAATVRTDLYQLCPTSTAKLPCLRIFSLTFWALHALSPKPIYYFRFISHVVN
jgi:hypothetical protein